ncbi:Phytochrome-like protein cph2 [invertebrate metagenome]|uniref:Phytochrome-like protein cph2 n=1 Tax=invertebrate metagenome TaxID=1711999 RepID=A0A2H9T764_9ZZZZ
MKTSQNMTETIRLLVVDPSAEKADNLVNVFRGAGYTMRVCHIDDQTSLDSSLAEKKMWDLLIISELPETLPLPLLLETIEHQSLDLPIIIVADYQKPSDRLQYLRMGIRAVVPSENMEMLLLFAGREVGHLQTRRNYRRMSVALSESEKQRRLLLDDQVDAVVYVSEGEVRYANSAFLQMIGKNDLENVLGHRFTEWVDSSQKESLSDQIDEIEKTGRAHSTSDALLLEGDNTVSVSMEISPTSYEGHFVLSLLVRGSSISQDKNEIALTEDGETGEETVVCPRETLLNQLDINIQRAVDGRGRSSLIYMAMNDQEQIVKSADKDLFQTLLSDVGKVIKNIADKHALLAGFGNGNFALLSDGNEEKVIQKLGSDIQAALSAETFSLNETPLSLVFSMGAVILCDNSCDAKTLVVRARNASIHAGRTGNKQVAFHQSRKVNVAGSVEKHLVMMVKQALQKNQLTPIFQPVISMKDNLSQWYDVQFKMQDARGREHNSTSFQTRLDRMPFWLCVDQWLLKSVCHLLREKRKDNKDTRLMLHLGGCQLQAKNFLSDTELQVKKQGLLPEVFAIVISEQNLSLQGEDAVSFFKEVRSSGMKIGISGFGCSVDPMEMVKKVNPDFVIIDPSFTDDLVNEKQGIKLKTIITALLEKQKQIMVTQVDTTQAMASLWAQGVDLISGNFIQDPAMTMDYDFDDNT